MGVAASELSSAQTDSVEKVDVAVPNSKKIKLSLIREEPQET